jgi:hypothetical protein
LHFPHQLIGPHRATRAALELAVGFGDFLGHQLAALLGYPVPKDIHQRFLFLQGQIAGSFDDV